MNFEYKIRLSQFRVGKTSQDQNQRRDELFRVLQIELDQELGIVLHPKTYLICISHFRVMKMSQYQN